AQLAYTIHNDIVSQVKRDLGLIPADPQMPILPAKRYQQTVMPILEDKPEAARDPFPESES
ncbi:MAG: hypothetical protein ACOYYF_15305, partial [Chloroflexota bacterium]